MIELLIAVSIISLTLFVILSAFMSSRAATVNAWDLTMENELNVQIMEQLKATPYNTLASWEQQYRVNGQAAGLDPRDSVFALQTAPQYDGIAAAFDLLAYEDNPISEVMKVVVRAGRVEHAGLIRKGELP